MGKGLTTAFPAVATELEEIPDSFLCCTCLDLLFKPIVLSCGHISCFWCVHKSMSSVQVSHCPICRHPYNHFPTVCVMLHALLLKLYPVAYIRREEQILEEEKEMGSSSPHFDVISCGSRGNQECDHIKVHECTSLVSNSCSETCSSRKIEVEGNHRQLSIADVQCTACKQLIFRPVFLNCGHGYCESCISCPVDDMLRCQLCHSLHPTDFPKVCLELDHFLEEQFPRDYVMRRDDVQPKQANTKIKNSTSCFARASRKGFPFSSPSKKEFFGSKIHIGVGCDFCGMYPIIGDRYRCKDCVEEIGFDLCGDCYGTRSKRPGRFNQQHTPEHKLERVDSNNIRRIIQGHIIRGLLTEHFEDVSVALANPDEVDIPVNESSASYASVGAEEATENILGTPAIHSESVNNENEI